MFTNQEQRTLAVFILMSVLAGGNAVGVRFSNRELDPLWGAAVRFALAAAVLLVLMAARKLAFPRGRALVGSVLYGLFSFGGAFALAYYGLVRIQAGLGQTLLALVPLATLLLAVVQRQEKLHLWAVVGTVLSVAGIAIVSSASTGESIPVLSLLALVGAAFCFAEAAVLVRQFPPVNPVVMNAVGAVTGAVFLFAGSVIAGEDLAVPREAATWAAIGYMAAIGSVVVFVLYVIVISEWNAPRASYTFVIMPIVTVVLSAWLDGERVGFELVIGGLLVLAGVYVGALRPGHLAAAAAEA